MGLDSIILKSVRKLSITDNLSKLVYIVLEQVNAQESLSQNIKVTISVSSTYVESALSSLLSTIDTTDIVNYKQSVQDLLINSSSTKTITQIENSITSFISVLNDNTKSSSFNITKKLVDYFKTDIENTPEAYQLYGESDIQILITIFSFVNDLLKNSKANAISLKNRMNVLTSNNNDYFLIKTLSDYITSLSDAIVKTFILNESLKSVRTSLNNGIDTTSDQITNITNTLTDLSSQLDVVYSKFLLIFSGSNNSLDYVA